MLYTVPCNVIEIGKLTQIFNPPHYEIGQIREIMANCSSLTSDNSTKVVKMPLC